MQPSLFGDAAEPPKRDPVFFGLRPPPAAREAIAEIGQRLRAAHALKGRPRPIATLHLSLHGLAANADEAAWLLIDACRAVQAVETPPFEVHFDRALTFRSRALKPLVLLPDETSKAAIVRLWSDIGHSLHRAALPAARQIEPHITLSRDPDALPELAVAPVGWTVEAFDLIWSHYGQGRHSLLHRVPLRQVSRP